MLLRHVKKTIAGFLALSLLSLIAAPTSADYLEIKGPRVLSFGLPTLDQETVIELPRSAQLLLIEEAQPRTTYLASEVRAYTIQQAFYWLAAVAILMYVRVNVR
jgi:hypothetical protein